MKMILWKLLGKSPVPNPPALNTVARLMPKRKFVLAGFASETIRYGSPVEMNPVTGEVRAARAP